MSRLSSQGLRAVGQLHAIGRLRCTYIYIYIYIHTYIIVVCIVCIDLSLSLSLSAARNRPPALRAYGALVSFVLAKDG